jgi:polyferredoxin
MNAVKVEAEKNRKRVSPFWNIQKLRYLSQLGFAVLVGVVVWQRWAATLGGGGAKGAPTGEALCPLGGFETLFSVFSTGQFISHTHLSNLVLFVVIVITAVIAKGFFCGWVCPLGSIQQAITGFRRWLGRRLKPLGAATRRMAPSARGWIVADRWLRYAKYGVLIWLIGGTIAFGEMVFRTIDPWVALVTLTEPASIGGLVMLGLTVVAAIFIDRPWCRYLCPLGAIIGLLGKIAPIKVQREAQSCTGCGLCGRACPMDIPVNVQSRVGAIDCNMCLNCTGACPEKGALEVHCVLPVRKKS